jgi:glycerophosphoryl diester phosphodiesterase
MPRPYALILVASILFALPTDLRAQQAPRNTVQRLRAALAEPSCPAVYVIGHRGAHRRAPENSLASIRHAIELGVHMVEIDVARSRDGAYVLMHDRTVDRTTTGTGKLRDLTLAELKKMHLMHGRMPTDETVPTLEEAIEVARGKILLQVDPKDVDFRTLVALGREKKALDHFVLKRRWQKMDEELRNWLSKQDGLFFMPITASLEMSREALDFHVWPALELLAEKPGHPHMDPSVLAGFRARGTLNWVNCLYKGRWSAGIGDYQAVPAQGKVFGDLIWRGFHLIQSDSPGLLAAYVRERGLDPLQLMPTRAQEAAFAKMREGYVAGQAMPPLVLAYRGSCLAAPMNSLAAIHAAIQIGAQGVSLDLRTTEDGRVLVTHADELKKTTWESGKISETPFAVARSYLLKHGVSQTLQPMPSLDEVLWAVRGKCFVHFRPDARQLSQLLHAAQHTGTLDHLLLDQDGLDTSRLTRKQVGLLGRIARLPAAGEGFVDARGELDRQLVTRGAAQRQNTLQTRPRVILSDIALRWLR